jgi:3-oxoacyl-[acyl-carrier-protein] synthase I
MDVTSIPVSDLLAHKPPMVLLDRVLSFEASTLVAEVTIGPDSMFCGAAGVPAWVGLEYMAQAVAAHAGVEARLRGVAPVIGYLLGTRSYTCDVDIFAVGETLTVHVEALFTEMSLGAFSCRIDTGATLARATINVYQPADDEPQKIDSGKISR